MVEKKELKEKICVISNITIPFLPSAMQSLFDQNAMISIVNHSEYNSETNVELLSSADAIVVWLNFESLFPDVWNLLDSKTITEQQIFDRTLSMCLKLHSELTNISKADIFWMGFEDYYPLSPQILYHEKRALVDKINLAVLDYFGRYVNFVDTKLLIANAGFINTFDFKGKYRWDAPYTKLFTDIVAAEIYTQYNFRKKPAKKCLVLDCDNVLWGGILSEDGIEGIRLGNTGKEHQEFQRFVLSLYYHGIILAVCSKNDTKDVLRVFRNHSGMILTEEHIACFRINWKSKIDNIMSIAENLNIGLNSIVFVDDSSIEIEAVKTFLPEVAAVRYDRNTIFNELACLNVGGRIDVEDAIKRQKTYQTNGMREVIYKQHKNHQDYLNALEIKIDLHQTIYSEYGRICELTQRTNRCSNGVRYTLKDLKYRLEQKSTCMYSLVISDKFADLGLVGAFEVEGSTLRLFSLSCRALGYHIEEKIISLLKKKHSINKVLFNQSDKNTELYKLLQEEFPHCVFADLNNSVCAKEEK